MFRTGGAIRYRFNVSGMTPIIRMLLLTFRILSTFVAISEAFISTLYHRCTGVWQAWCLVTLLMVIITAVQVMINQLATRGPLSSSTVTDSETDNDF